MASNSSTAIISQRHKVFVSYHHENDENYKRIFLLRFGNKFQKIIPNSVEMGDINTNLRAETIRQKIRDEYLRDSTVTVVLVGTETWKRKHVDWEISSSIRSTELNPRSGLVGILLPSYQQRNPDGFDAYTIPPRLYYNYACGFAKIYNWCEDPAIVAHWISAAFHRRRRIEPDNSFPTFINNRSGDRWY